MDNPDLTVAIISHGDFRALETSLTSLREQSLSPTSFQVLLLRYDPTTRDQETGKSFRELVPITLDRGEIDQGEPVTDLDELSIYMRRTEYLTFLWEGDLLSPYFLEVMLNASEQKVVPHSQVVEVLSSGRKVQKTPINMSLLAKGGYLLSLVDCSIEFLREPVGKLFRCKIMTNDHIDFITTADWLSLQVSLLLDHDYAFSKIPAAVGATYYRSKSVPRARAAYRFDNAVDHAFQKLQDFQVFRERSLTNTQRIFLSSIEAHFMMLIRDAWEPTDNQSAFQAMADLPLRGLPWEVLNEPVDTIAIVANFAPHAGTAGIVAGKRIIDRGKRVDLISSVVSSRKRYTKDLLLTEPYLRNHKIHSPRIRGDNDVDFRHFLNDALSTLEIWQDHGAEYRYIYSRSMMPHSHIVAAAIKRRYPDWHWTAEFSDPNSVDAQGNDRLASFKTASAFPEFQGWGTPKQQELLSSDLRLYRWAELLPYFHADELLFTNEHQKKIMLASAPEEYRESIRDKSVVQHHPTLPPGYYRLSEPDLIEADRKILLGYFGNFYDTRGLTEIIEALDQLEDAELQRFKLVIYTGSREERIHSGFPKRVRRIMNIKPRLDYLTSLATMNCMDYLIVNDADTSEYFPVNPFLPSKVSDYVGSKARVWAIFEADSVLSQFKFNLRSALGDTQGALQVLRRILETND